MRRGERKKKVIRDDDQLELYKRKVLGTNTYNTGACSSSSSIGGVNILCVCVYMAPLKSMVDFRRGAAADDPPAVSYKLQTTSRCFYQHEKDEGGKKKFVVSFQYGRASYKNRV